MDKVIVGMKINTYIKHVKLTELLEKVGFEYVHPHRMNRGSKEYVLFCGSCLTFKHFINDKLVKELKGDKFSFVPQYIENSVKLGSYRSKKR